MNTVAEKSSTGLDANVAAALAYIPIVAIVFLVIEKGSRLVKFHAVQSLGLLVAWMAIWFVLVDHRHDSRPRLGHAVAVAACGHRHVRRLADRRC